MADCRRLAMLRNRSESVPSKTADFFERYLKYSESPQLFLHDADSLNIGRVVLPLRYYARWNKLIVTLDSVELWHIAYQDSFFVVIDRKNR